ncbi:MAG: cobalamin-binding protein [Methanosphaera stadtmanae]|jgi:methanol corrinoid protein|nr:cobalamin-binding protein [Methanosphaera stadtmanae]
MVSLDEYYENIEDYENIAVRYNVVMYGPALKPEEDPEVAEILPEDPMKREIALAVLHGDMNLTNEKTQEGLDAGGDPVDLINNALMKGMDSVSALYTKGIYFLPDLMLSGDAMMSGVNLCESSMGHKADSKASVMSFAVEGDPHDIGKNLVVMFLNANGYDAVDLGRDVPAADVVEKAKEVNPAVMTATALMTTTMTQFEVIVAALQEAGLDIPVGCGGGAVRRDFVEETPQTFYGVAAYHMPKIADAIVDDGKTWEDIRNEYQDIVGEYVKGYAE